MKILIWGTGRLVGKVVGKYIENEKIWGFIDNNTSKLKHMGKPVYSPAEISHIDYDAILIANLYAHEIRQQCIELGIDINKVIFLYGNCKLEDMNKDYTFIEKILGTEYSEIIRKRYHVIGGVEAYGDLCFKNSPYAEEGYADTDYVRYKTFELVVKEIRKRALKGAVAEVGVFRGEFAQYLNYAFPNKKCYLFDTFEGFDANEALKEIKQKNCTEAFVEAYKQTDLSIVLDRMTNLETIIIKQGYFPESLNGLEEEFTFVSLDVDFEDSIYEGLKYFYPRLVKGGYIFIHDYNSDLLGVEKAVDRYEKDYNMWLCKIPLSDKNGSLIITK